MGAEHHPTAQLDAGVDGTTGSMLGSKRLTVATFASKDSANPKRAVTIGGKKFLWDGRLFETLADGSRQAEAYKNDSFEVQMVEVGGNYLVYTRRLVKEVVVTAP